MAAKLILVGALLLAAVARADDEPERRRIPLRRFESRLRSFDTAEPTSSTTASPDPVPQDGESAIERRRQLLNSLGRRRTKFRTSLRKKQKVEKDEQEAVKQMEEEEEEKTVKTPRQRPIKIKLTSKAAVSRGTTGTTGRIVNDLPNSDSPVEKLTNPEIRQAILGKPEENEAPFKGISVVKTISEPSGRRSLNEQLVRVSFKTSTEQPTTTTSNLPTEAPQQTFARRKVFAANAKDSQVNRLDGRRRVKTKKRVVKKNRKNSLSPLSERRNSPRRLQTQRRFNRPNAVRPAIRPSSRGRRPVTTTSAPTTTTTTTTRVTTTTTKRTTIATTRASITTRRPLIASLNTIDRKNFKSKNAALAALLQTAGEDEVETEQKEALPARTPQPETEALEEVSAPKNRQEAAVFEMKEDIRNIIPSRRNPPSRRKEEEKDESEVQFESFPVQGSRASSPARSRLADTPSAPATSPRRRQRQRVKKIKVNRGNSNKNRIHVAPKQRVQVNQASRALPAKPIRKQPTFLPKQVEAEKSADPPLPKDIPAVFKDFELDSAELEFAFTTNEANPSTVSSFVNFQSATTSRPRSNFVQDTTPERLVEASRSPLPPRLATPAAPIRQQSTLPVPGVRTPTTTTTGEVPVTVVLPEQPVQADPVVQLRNGQFAAFDAQFQGVQPVQLSSLPPVDDSQTASGRFPADRRPLPQIVPLATLNRVAAASSGQFNRFQPLQQPFIVRPQQQQSQQPQQQQSAAPAFGRGVPGQSFQLVRPAPFTAFAGQPRTGITPSQPQFRQPTFASQPTVVNPQQFQQQPTFASQTPVSQQPTFVNPSRQQSSVQQVVPVNLPSGTFTGHPAGDININTGSFSFSTGL